MTLEKRLKPSPLYREYSAYLREVFGCRVQKITVDAGLTCPNRDGSVGTGGCVYCNALGSGTGEAARGMSITEQLERGKERLGKRYGASKFLAYFQSFSNTYAPVPILRKLYEEALAVPDIVGLTIGTRPDCVSEPVLDLLGEIASRHFLWMEYGLQSIHDTTLDRIGRGHTAEVFTDAVSRTRRRGIPVCVHVILGLPGEDLEAMLDTARALARMDIQGIKIHLLYVIRGTVLGDWYADGRYRCLTREEYVEAVGRFIRILPPGVVIQRVTGDPHPDELVAPAWARDKRGNIEAIRDLMTSRGWRQGQEAPLSGESPDAPPVRAAADHPALTAPGE